MNIDRLKINQRQHQIPLDAAKRTNSTWGMKRGILERRCTTDFAHISLHLGVYAFLNIFKIGHKESDRLTQTHVVPTCLHVYYSMTVLTPSISHLIGRWVQSKQLG